jgi:integrase
MNGISDMFRYASGVGHIVNKDLPKIPYQSRKGVAVDRSQFSVKEYIKLRRLSLKRIREARNKRVRFERQVLDFVIRLMATTGLRTHEAVSLRWADCTPVLVGVRRLRTCEIHIPGNDTKEGRDIAVKPYVWISIRRFHDLTDQPDDQPLCPWGDLEGSFGQLVIAAGLKFDQKGNRRILYSLRHSYAQWSTLYRRWPSILTAKMMGHKLTTHTEIYARIEARQASEDLIGNPAI